MTGTSSDSPWASAKVVKNAAAISNPAMPEVSRQDRFIANKPNPKIE
jgi:hypothetical protein